MHEKTYIEANKILQDSARHRFEFSHLHTDLLTSAPHVSPLTETTLKFLLSKPKTVPFDKKAVLDLLKEDKDFPPSIHAIGLIHELDGKFIEAFHVYQSNTQFAPSECRLATLIAKGHFPKNFFSVEEDPKEVAFKLAQSAFNKGFTHAVNLLGILHETNIGVPKTLTAKQRKTISVKFYEQASKLGCASAMHNIGLKLTKAVPPYEHITEEERQSLAFELFEKSAKLDNFESMHELAKLIQNGHGPAKFFSDAKKIRTTTRLILEAEKGGFYTEADVKKVPIEFVELVKSDGIFVHDFLEAIFINGFVSEDEKNYGKVIEGDGFILHSKEGFPLNAIGSLCQGNKELVSEVGLIPIKPDYTVMKVEDLDIPKELIRGEKAKIANIVIDLGRLTESKGFEKKFEIKCQLIIDLEK